MKTNKFLVLQMAEVYGEQMSDTRLNLFLEVLSCLSPDELKTAIKKALAEKNRTRMPLPAYLISLVRPDDVESHEDKAKKIASDILSAIAMFGWNNPERAKLFLGHTGWDVVNRQGGWVTLCEMVNQDNFTIFQAQLRDLALVCLRNPETKTHQGNLKTIPNNFGDVLKSLPK